MSQLFQRLVARCAAAFGAFGLMGCLESPAPATPAHTEVQIQQLRAAMQERDRALMALQSQIQFVYFQLLASRDDAPEGSRGTGPRATPSSEGPRAGEKNNAELHRRLDQLVASHQRLTEALAHKRSREDAARGAPSVVLDPSDETLKKLRQQLSDEGGRGLTLTPEQARALLKALRPMRPVDTESPYVL
jgi:hypothetical protein